MKIVLMSIVKCVCIHNCASTVAPDSMQFAYQQYFVSNLPKCIQDIHESMKNVAVSYKELYDESEITLEKDLKKNVAGYCIQIVQKENNTYKEISRFPGYIATNNYAYYAYSFQKYHSEHKHQEWLQQKPVLQL